jgi:hypothetical protein
VPTHAYAVQAQPCFDAPSLQGSPVAPAPRAAATAADVVAESDALRVHANSEYKARRYARAEELYTQAYSALLAPHIEASGASLAAPPPPRPTQEKFAVVLNNRAAARLMQVRARFLPFRVSQAASRWPDWKASWPAPWHVRVCAIWQLACALHSPVIT